MLVLNADNVRHLKWGQSLGVLREEQLLSGMPPGEGLLSLLHGQSPLLPGLEPAWLHREEVSDWVAKDHLGW